VLIRFPPLCYPRTQAKHVGACSGFARRRYDRISIKEHQYELQIIDAKN
jgi:hypothetical protein